MRATTQSHFGPQLEWHESEEGITFSVRVVPRGRRDEIIGAEAGALKVRLKAPPVEGKANDALVRFLAATFGVKPADVDIFRGANSRHKIIRVRGASAAQLGQILKP